MDHPVSEEETKSKEIAYPNLAQQVDLSRPFIQSFLPFLKEYSFFDAYRATSNLLEYCIAYNVKAKHGYNTNILQSLFVASTNFLTIHALLSDWNQEIWILESLDVSFEYIENLDELHLMKHLEKGVSISNGENFGMEGRHTQIIISLKRCLLQSFGTKNKIDLTDYLY